MSVRTRAAALAFVLGLVAYLNTCWNGFVFDDRRVIVENHLVVGPLRLDAVFTSDYWGLKAPQPNTGFYRPLATLTYAFNHALHGVSPGGYHFVNALLHALISALCTTLALGWLSASGATLAGVIFALHPLHSDAVAGAVGRADLLGALLLVSSWLLMRSRRGLLAGVLGGAALLSKENTIVLPALVLADSLYRLPREARAGLVRDVATVFRSERRFFLSWLATFACVCALRAHALGALTSFQTVRFFDNPLFFAPTGERIVGAIATFARACWLCIWPVPLSADYSYAAIDLPKSVFAPTFLVGAALMLTFVVIALVSAIRDRFVFLCVAIFLGPYLVTSNILVRTGGLFAERWLYLPILGLGIAFMRAVAPLGRAGVIGVSVLGVLLGARTIVRNRDWKNDFALFSAAARIVPDSAVVQTNLGVEYGRRGDLRKAAQHLERALAIYPKNAHALLNYANVLERTDRPKDAIRALEQATEFDVNLEAAYLRLIEMAQRQGDTKLAVQTAERFAKAAPYAIERWLGLANVAREGKELGTARLALEKLLEQQPEHRPAAFALADVLRDLGDAKAGLQLFTTLAERHPRDAEVHFYLGNFHALYAGQLDEHREAERAAHREQAVFFWRRALVLAPGHEGAKKNLEIVGGARGGH